MSWTAASGTGVAYQYCYAATNPCANWTATSNSSVQLASLSPNTVYYWNVRAVNSFGTLYSDASTADWSFRTDAAMPPIFSASPTSWNYGLVKAGTATAAKSFTITNTGGSNLNIGTVALAGTQGGQFRITANSCSSQTLSAGATCSISVTFNPTTAGRKTAYINIPDNATGNPHTIALSGKGGTEQSLNGGFNAYPSPATKIPTNWVAARFASTDGKNTADKKEGTASVKIANTSAVGKTLTQTRNVSGGAGSSFVLRLWAKGQGIPTAGGVVQAKVMLYNGTTVVQTKTVTLPNQTYGFTQKTLSFTASGAYTRIVIQLIYSKGSGAVWFDGLSLLGSP